jgi:hypothetical protein
MTRDDIIKMAREAGLLPILNEDAFQKWEWEKTNKVLERFAALVADHTLSNIDPSKFMSYQEAYEAGQFAEREACAKLCSEEFEYYGHDHIFAAAIRARGEK